MDDLILKPLVRAAAAVNPIRPGDYQKDGLLYCGSCNTAKQSRQMLSGKPIVLPCLCKCATAARDDEDAARRKREAQDRAERARETGIYSQDLRHATFAAADGVDSGPLRVVKNYAENWEMFYRENTGLLLYGGVGTGKSFAAACLANHLIDRGINAVMLNFSEFLNILGDTRKDDRLDIFDRVSKCPLFILDDFGAERNTPYSLEQMFNLVDTRVRSGRPLVITTNLGHSELKAPTDLAHKRIFDRILENCLPVFFDGGSRRADIARRKFENAAEILRR